jgi:hypothetical protein
MPRHQQVTACRRNGGPVSKHCTCEHCTLSVCSVCGAYEGGLTTDCPGTKVDYDRQKEVHETRLDYTDDRGWHQGDPTKQRSPRFASTKLAPNPMAPVVDPRALVAPSVDWAAVDRNAGLQHELSLKAIAWVIADRACDDDSAKLARAEDESDSLRGKTELDDEEREILARLERAQVDFRLSSSRADRCQDEFHQAGRKLVEALESGPLTRCADREPR